MRPGWIIALFAAAALLPLQLALAGGESPSARRAAVESSPRHQLLGDWRARGMHLRISMVRGVLQGRTLSDYEAGDCRVERGTRVMRGFSFTRQDGATDVWQGTATLPAGSACRSRARPATVTIASDLSFREEIGRRELRFRRIRPAVRADDPVVGVWERNEAGVIVEARRKIFVGRARERFLIANGCTIAAGTVVWRLRPRAPDRYDGTTRTFAAPPGCAPVGSSPSRWKLTAERMRLVRVGPDGSAFEYERAR
jgi:hypothetical protein